MLKKRNCGENGKHKKKYKIRNFHISLARLNLTEINTVAGLKIPGLINFLFKFNIEIKSNALNL